MRAERPKCKLPEIFITSNLIGKTATTLRRAQREDELRDFFKTIKSIDTRIDYYTILRVAEKYVDFYE
jgi:hypothetical protein